MYQKKPGMSKIIKLKIIFLFTKYCNVCIFIWKKIWLGCQVSSVRLLKNRNYLNEWNDGRGLIGVSWLGFTMQLTFEETIPGILFYCYCAVYFPKKTIHFSSGWIISEKYSKCDNVFLCVVNNKLCQVK